MAPHDDGLKLTRPALVTSARASQLDPRVLRTLRRQGVISDA